MLKRFLLLSSLLFAAVNAAFSDTEEVFIEKIAVEPNGRNTTEPETLKSYLQIYEGQIFDSEADLSKAVEIELQSLKNTRYFSYVEIRISGSAENENGYILTLEYEDDWTFLPIPYPLPESDIGINGWRFGLQINYDNCFGTMTDFLIDGDAGFAFGEADKLKKWEIESSIKNLRLGKQRFSVEYNQLYSTTEVIDPNAAEGYQLLQHYTNHSSSLKLATSFKIAPLLTYAVYPEAGMKYLYDYHSSFEGASVQNNSDVIEDRLSLIFGQEIRYSDVDWINRVRDGFEVKLLNNLRLLNSYDNGTTVESMRIASDFNLTANYYLNLTDSIYYYTEAAAIVVINDYETGLGDKLRGVKNSSMYGDLGFFWKNTLGIEVFGFDSLFIQLHPYVDVGAAFYTPEMQSIGNAFRVGFGTDIVIMFGSVDLRATIGYDPVSGYIDIGFSNELEY